MVNPVYESSEPHEVAAAPCSTAVTSPRIVANTSYAPSTHQSVAVAYDAADLGGDGSRSYATLDRPQKAVQHQRGYDSLTTKVSSDTEGSYSTLMQAEGRYGAGNSRTGTADPALMQYASLNQQPSSFSESQGVSSEQSEYSTLRRNEEVLPPSQGYASLKDRQDAPSYETLSRANETPGGETGGEYSQLAPNPNRSSVVVDSGGTLYDIPLDSTGV